MIQPAPKKKKNDSTLCRLLYFSYVRFWGHPFVPRYRPCSFWQTSCQFNNNLRNRLACTYFDWSVVTVSCLFSWAKEWSDSATFFGPPTKVIKTGVWGLGWSLYYAKGHQPWHKTCISIPSIGFFVNVLQYWFTVAHSTCRHFVFPPKRSASILEKDVEN